MVARPARRLDPAPASPTPFADAALVLRDLGLAPVPLGGDDGKVPLVKWGTWKQRPGRLLSAVPGTKPARPALDRAELEAELILSPPDSSRP